MCFTTEDKLLYAGADPAEGEMTMENQYRLDKERYAALARRAAAEGVVLLRNEEYALPLKAGQSVAVFGRIQFDYYRSGTGSGGMVNAPYTVGILDALKEEELVLDTELEETYRNWIVDHPYDQGQGWAQEPWNQEEMPLAEDIVRAAAGRAGDLDGSSTAIVVIGRTAGEDRDAKAEKGSYFLTDLEEDMLARVCAAFDKVAVLLNIGSVMDMEWVERYAPQAVLCVWQGGMEGGHGAADVLMGRVNPCGKLPDTIAHSIDDYPSTRNFGGDTTDNYEEDIYVGYRYFETFAKDKVLYSFGFGLSYTAFSTEDISVERVSAERLSAEQEKGCSRIRVSLTVRNAGETAGREVVQVYVRPPQGKLGKPLRSLAAFAKTDVLEPGGTQEIELMIPDHTLASYDDSGATGHRSCWVMEPGKYEFYVGGDVRSASLVGWIDIDELKVIERCQEAAAPEKAFRRMKPADAEKGLTLTWEEVPVRSGPMREHICCEYREIPYTGDQGIRLGDVYDGKADLETFIAQISDEGLCCLVKGEGMSSPKVTPGTAAAFGGLTEELRELGIPCGCCADGPSGIRMDCGAPAFSLPGGVCLASTFDEELLEELYAMEGLELRQNRIDLLLGPGMNIHRNPLNGRNFEYFSEDPLLTGKMASAQLRGMSRYGTTGVLKHFAANNQEHNRRKYNSVVSERALREIYLRGFEIAVKEGGARAVMTTYGAVNGIWTAGNYDLNTKILRDEWGFDGLVMTDWWAEMNDEGQEPSIQNLAAMVRSQNDIFMVVPDTEKHMGNLKERLEAGTLTRAELQRSAVNILDALLKAPAMERILERISDEEQEAYGMLSEEERVDFDMPLHIVEDELVLPVGGLCTDRGHSEVFALDVRVPGNYRLNMKVSADGGELAQVPVSVFLNGTLAGTITINGTGGEWIEVRQDLGYIVFPNVYMRLYFAQSGMRIDSVRIQRDMTTLGKE